MTELITQSNNMRYDIQTFKDIIFDGFECYLPESSLSIITELAQQVGSPTYIRTPVFEKRTISTKGDGLSENSSYSGEDSFTKRKRKNNNNNSKNQEITDADWESIRSFQATKMDKKEGIDAQIDIIRGSLNKMSEKNYNDQFDNIIGVLDELINTGSSEDDMLRVGNAIFEIASNNRFYSKLYADLYTGLIRKYELMNTIFQSNLQSFLTIFENIEHVTAEENYDKFCKINKDNERRKSLCSFFVNLTANTIISEQKLVDLTTNLILNVLDYINKENMKSEVDEIIENVALLYNKNLFACYDNIIYEGKTFTQVIEMIARSKAKTFPSLSNKAIFKCMDMVEI